jgi:hypothetical protein
MLDLTDADGEAWYDVVDDTPVVENHRYAPPAAPPPAAGHKRAAGEQPHPQQQQQQHSRQRLTAAMPAASGDAPQAADLQLGSVWYATSSTEVERLWTASLCASGATMCTWGSQAGEPASAAMCLWRRWLPSLNCMLIENIRPSGRHDVQPWPCSSCRDIVHC